MIINKIFECPDCGRTVEGIKVENGSFRIYCAKCHDWYYVDECEAIKEN